MNQGKCPKCARLVEQVEVDEVDLRLGQWRYRGWSYYCAECKTVLGIEFKPTTLRDEIVRKTVSDLTHEIRRN